MTEDMIKQAAHAGAMEAALLATRRASKIPSTPDDIADLTMKIYKGTYEIIEKHLKDS
jgi:hypothetical protein